jgi:orotate phosphoribosyltransferase
VGAALRGRVFIIDDAISAGTSVRESVDVIRHAGAVPCGVLIALDRQERGAGTHSAAQEVERDYAIPVISIAKLDTLMTYLAQSGYPSPQLEAIAAYRETYGA